LHGWFVKIICRSAEPRPSDNQIEYIVADRDNADDWRRVGDLGGDVLVDTIAYDKAEAEQLIDVQSNFGAMAVISSASVYRDARGRTLDEAAKNGFPDFGGPILESQGTVPPGPETYSTRKVALEQRLQDGVHIPLSILRPCAVYGIGSTHPREWWFVKRMLDGRKHIILTNDGESRFQTTAADNMGALLLHLADNKLSGIYNIGDDAPPRVLQIGQHIAALLDMPINWVTGQFRDNLLGRSPWSIPGEFLVNSDAALASGYTPLGDYDALVGDSIGWLRDIYGQDSGHRFSALAAYPFDLFDYAREDAFLAAQTAP